jgi:phage head maturation protease
MDLETLSKQLGVDLVKDAEDLEPVEGAHSFTIFTRDHKGQGLALKAFEEKVDGQEEPDFVISGIASSTIKDLHGDTILPSAMIDMERAAKNNLTIFLNHSTSVPEDVAGSVRDAKLASVATDESGNPIYDLDFKIRVEKTNDRAVKTFRAIEAGTKLGLSIGAQIPEGGAIRNKRTGTLLISHLNLLETSIVGIPANPRSWVESAVKSLKSAPKVDSGEPIRIEVDHIVVDTPRVDVAAAAPTSTTDTDPTPDPAPAELVVKSDNPSQGAPQSTPGADGAAAPVPDVAASATPAATPLPEIQASASLYEALAAAQTSLGDTTLKLIDAQGALRKAESERDTAMRERDTAIAVAKDVTRDAAQIIQRLGALPVGQRASFKAIADDFAGLEDVYGSEFVTTLRSFTQK